MGLCHVDRIGSQSCSLFKVLSIARVSGESKGGGTVYISAGCQGQPLAFCVTVDIWGGLDPPGSSMNQLIDPGPLYRPTV